jgi:alpha-L-rhamnosidase
LDSGASVQVPANTHRRVLIDLDEYVCGYPELRLQGGPGAVLNVRWLEALLDSEGRKGNRDEVEGRFFRTQQQAEIGVGDRFVSGGGDHTYSTLWWEAGRFVEMTVDTADEPLTVAGFAVIEDRYPYEDASTFASSDPKLDGIKALGVRTLQMCSHETTMDCPFYEQLQYAGDTRLQLLVAYMISDDDRLARQALLAFDRSRDTRGLTRSRYPSSVRQTIPPFSLWWVAMVRDFAAWRGDLEFVATLMPGVRAVLDAFRAGLDENDLLHSLDGWNFTDWVNGWKSGSPPEGDWGVSGILNFQLAHVAGLAADLETWLGEPELATRHRKLADRVLAAAEQQFWSADRGMYADDPAHEHWSEHANSLALLAGAKNGEAGLLRSLETPQASQATVYFSHYLFEALGQIGRVDVLRDRLSLWTGLREEGLRTVIEQPEPTRSDCHAWGAHPIFHLFATVLGVRPAAPGMAEITVNPQLGGLGWAEGTLRTPHGPLRVRVDDSGTTVDLPTGIARLS